MQLQGHPALEPAALQRHLQDVLMSLSASLANAAVMALRFQESCAVVFFRGPGNFPG